MGGDTKPTNKRGSVVLPTGWCMTGHHELCRRPDTCVCDKPECPHGRTKP